MLLCSISVSALATNTEFVDTAIVEDVISSFSEIAEVDIDANATVSITDSYISIEKENIDGVPETTYIVGIEKTEDGLQKINPNALTKEIQSRGSYQQTVYYRNLLITSRIYMTVTFTVTYSQYNGTASSYIYRPSGVSAYWTAGSYTPNITVSDFYVYYDSCGELVQFPACNTASDLSSLVVESDYSHTITLYRSSPTAGTTYSSYSSLASNRALWFANAYFHGSSVSFDIDTSQGTYTDSVDLGRSY